MDRPDDEVDEWFEGQPIYVMRPHPYFLAKPSMFWCPGRKVWVVKWRDFSSMMQDVEFEHQAAAAEFYGALCRRKWTVFYDNGDFAECDALWRRCHPE